MKNFFFATTFLPLLMLPAAARACSCLERDPPAAFNEARAVFIGRMLGGTEKFSLEARAAGRGRGEPGRRHSPPQRITPRGDIKDLRLVLSDAGFSGGCPD